MNQNLRRIQSNTGGTARQPVDDQQNENEPMQPKKNGWKTFFIILLVLVAVVAFILVCRWAWGTRSATVAPTSAPVSQDQMVATAIAATQQATEQSVVAVVGTPTPVYVVVTSTPEVQSTPTLVEPTASIIDGYGQQTVDYSSINGKKVYVYTDKKDPNGFPSRQPVPVSSPAELGITWVPSFPYTSLERDFIVSENNYAPYATIVVDPKIADTKAMLQYAVDNTDVKVTTVVDRLDGQGKVQECSLDGIQPQAVRYNVYRGSDIKYQLCDPSWTTK
jgi:hypothetical protein